MQTFATGVVTTPGLHVRLQPGGEVIGILSRGDIVEVLGKVQHKKLWYCVRPEKQPQTRGYVLAVDIQLSDSLWPTDPDPRLSEGPHEIYPPPADEKWWFAGASAVIALVTFLLWYLR